MTDLLREGLELELEPGEKLVEVHPGMGWVIADGDGEVRRVMEFYQPLRRTFVVRKDSA